MSNREVMQQALEALEGVLDDAPKVLDASISGGLYEVVQCRDAITAIKEALAREHAMHDLARLGQEIEQEPVAWAGCGECDSVFRCHDGKARCIRLPREQQAEPPPEWESIKNILDEYGLQAICFVAEWKAAQRQPLTDKQILADETLRYYFGQNGGAGPVSKQGRKVVDAIEAAHNIKEQP